MSVPDVAPIAHSDMNCEACGAQMIEGEMVRRQVLDGKGVLYVHDVCPKADTTTTITLTYANEEVWLRDMAGAALAPYLATIGVSEEQSYSLGRVAARAMLDAVDKEGLTLSTKEDAAKAKAFDEVRDSLRRTSEWIGVGDAGEVPQYEHGLRTAEMRMDAELAKHLNTEDKESQ